MSLYENLPGIELTVKDGNLVLPAEPASTQTVLIIGITTESGVANIVTGGTAQISTMKVTAAATATGNITIDGVSVAVTTGDAVAAVATKIAAATFPNWTVTANTDTVTFTAKTAAANKTIVFSAGTTGVTMAAQADTTPGVAGTVTVDCNPKRVYESADFQKYSLGLFNKTNPLARAWKQVNDSGCRAIYCLKLYGLTAEERYSNLHTIFSVLEDNFRTDIICYAGIKADTALNTAGVTLTCPREDYAVETATIKEVKAKDTFDMADGTALKLASPFIANLQDSIAVKRIENTDPDNPVVLVANTDYTIDADNREIVLVAAATASQTIEVEYSTYDYSFPDQLAGFCAVVSEKNNQVVSVLGMKAPSAKDLATIKTYVDGQKIQEYNQYLQVVGGATLFFEIGNEPYEDDFSASYAGLISYLPSYSSPTNKVVPGALFASYNLSPAQVKALTNKHIVVPRTKNGRVIIGDAVTTAADTSDFVRLTTVRIVNDAVNLVREIADPYIGEPNSLPRRNALDNALNTGLKAMINRGALTNYRLVLKSSLSDQIDGTMRIALDLVPVFETRRIIVTVALKPTL